MRQKDYYQILGLPSDADSQAIRRNWRLLCLLLHPDTIHPDRAKSTPDLPVFAKNYFENVQEAYDILRDPDKRAAYDNEGSVSTSDREEYDQLTTELEWWRQQANKFETQLEAQKDRALQVEQKLKQEQAQREGLEKKLTRVENQLGDEHRKNNGLENERKTLTSELRNSEVSVENERQQKSLWQSKYYQQETKAIRSGRILSQWRWIAISLILVFVLSATSLIIIARLGLFTPQIPKTITLPSPSSEPTKQLSTPTVTIIASPTSINQDIHVLFTPPLSATISGMRSDKSIFIVAMDFQITEAIISTDTITFNVIARRTRSEPHIWPPDERSVGYLQDTQGKYKLIRVSGFITQSMSLVPGTVYTGSMTFMKPIDDIFELSDPHIRLNKPISLDN